MVSSNEKLVNDIETQLSIVGELAESGMNWVKAVRKSKFDATNVKYLKQKLDEIAIMGEVMSKEVKRISSPETVKGCKCTAKKTVRKPKRA